MRDWLGAGADAPFYMKFFAGALTGGVGSVVGNPFDVLKVRVEWDYLKLFRKMLCSEKVVFFPHM